ncbi:hypothetical protein BT63DRAFT_456741 [Microthyrium microscopicum]|uniref:Uncharacterized protein n=1 Tax=Microthyrium microscopicum TaxID=703497 RepID=A0A6A6U592_9PEZI|nr:hypothetical protein BT63DRAFT_456741 [Microthyrium microscopicum]
MAGKYSMNFTTGHTADFDHSPLLSNTFASLGAFLMMCAAYAMFVLFAGWVEREMQWHIRDEDYIFFIILVVAWPYLLLMD